MGKFWGGVSLGFGVGKILNEGVLYVLMKGVWVWVMVW